MFIKKLVVGPYASNCYIVSSGENKDGVIIDAGADADTILELVNELGIIIKYIVLTHGHVDHIAATKKVKEATGAEVAIHQDDARLMQEHSEAAIPARLLKGGDTINFGEARLVVLHTPGHSSGSISLLGNRVVFTGDTLFNYGIGRYDLPGGSYSRIMNSIKTKLMVLPDDTLVYPGHGPETSIGAERRANPFLRG